MPRDQRTSNNNQHEQVNQGVEVPAGGPMFWEGMPMTVEVQLTKWVVFERPLLAQTGRSYVENDQFPTGGEIT